MRYQLPLHLQKVSQISLIISSFLILIFCKDISGYLSNYEREMWFYYFTIVERISMLLLLIASLKYLKTISWVGAELILCWLCQDLIDRVFSNIKEVTLNDYIVTGVLITIAIIKYKTKLNDNITKNKKFNLVE